MSASWLLLFGILPALCAAQFPILPTACRAHEDCRRTRDDFYPGNGLPEHSLALCERGLCTPLTNFTCKGTNDCGLAWGCRVGRCVQGGLGAACRTDSENCLPGFSCDARTKKCVRGVTGVVCRFTSDCGFGHSCFYKKNSTSGVCKPGLLGPTACVRDMHCPGPLQCFRAGPAGRYNSQSYRCGRPFDLPTTPRPRTFGTCETDAECRPGPIGFSLDLACIRGTCRSPRLGQPCKKRLDCGYYSYCRKGVCAPSVVGSSCERLED